MKETKKNSLEKGNKRLDYTKLPLINLLSLVAGREEAPNASDRALMELITRVNPFLRNTTHYFCSLYHIHSTLVEQEVVSAITLTMYDNIHALLETMKKHTQEQHMPILEAWLSNYIEEAIQENQSDRKKEIKIVYDDIDNYSERPDESDDNFTEENGRRLMEQKAILDQASTGINPKNLQIVLTYCQYKEGRKHLPDEILEKVSSESKVTKHYAAKINRRTFRALYKRCHKIALQISMAANHAKGTTKK